MEKFAPIALFAYNRADHLANTIRALSLCPEWTKTRVIVYSDGPRSEHDARPVDSVRRQLQGVSHPRLEIIARPRNLGLSASIVSGVTDICARFGRVIVVEDDLVVSPLFLRYMNEALDAYAGRHDIFQVSGHMFDVREFENKDDVVLMPITTTWGWATWQRAWQFFEPSAVGWERLRWDRRERKRFNLGNAYNYFAMLERQMRGRGDSWGIRWYWSVFSRDGLACYPPRSLVMNSGMDGTGSHGRGKLRNFRGAANLMLGAVPRFPAIASRCSDEDFLAVKRAIWRQNGGWRGRLADTVRLLSRYLPWDRVASSSRSS
jgi:hypothetical protein